MKISKLKIPAVFNVRVIVSYQGKEIDKTYFDDNIDFKKLYFSDHDFLSAYLDLKSNTSEGRMSILDVSEHGIKKHLDILPL